MPLLSHPLQSADAVGAHVGDAKRALEGRVVVASARVGHEKVHPLRDHQRGDEERRKHEHAHVQREGDEALPRALLYLACGRLQLASHETPGPFALQPFLACLPVLLPLPHQCKEPRWLVDEVGGRQVAERLWRWQLYVLPI